MSAEDLPLPETQGPTGEYRRLATNPAEIAAMGNEALLDHHLATRLLIEYGDNPLARMTNQVRLSFVFTVSGMERREILRRMAEGHGTR